MRTAALAVLSALVGWLAVSLALVVGDDRRDPPPANAAASGSAQPQRGAAGDRPRPKPPKPEPRLPTAAGLESASRYAAARGGEVAFAVVDTEGDLRGRSVGRLFSAASTVKAMLLAAELQRLERERLPLDPDTDRLLEAMITLSDNDAADAIHARVGDSAMFAIAHRAGMDRFTESGHWGNAQVSAADLALLFARLDRVLPSRFRTYGLGLLGSVAAEQSWGIPAAARPGWAVRFKGGWLPDRGLVHQAAELRDRERKLAIAVLTDAQLSFEHATETVQGIAARLLSSSGDPGDA